jgi:hypothetical protein
MMAVKDIPATANRHDVSGYMGLRLELFPQRGDVHVYGASFRGAIIPHSSKQLRPGYNPVSALIKVSENANWKMHSDVRVP